MTRNLALLTLALCVFISFQAAAQLSITSFTPTRFAGNVPVNGNITVIFNQNIDGATLNSSTFVVRGSLTGVIAGTLTGAGTNTVTFNPASDFELGENISFTITDVLRSTLGFGLTRGHTYSFDVISGATTVAPHNFAFRLLSYASGLSPNDIKAMDINNDGHMDFVLANEGSGSDDTWACTNDGNMEFCRVEFGENRNAEMFDLDGDGDKDGLNVRPNVFGFSWSRNDGGVFTTIDLSANRIAYNGFCYGSDMDNDGDIDLIGFNSATLNPPAGVVMHRNNGGGTFSGLVGLFNPPSAPFLASDSHMRIADINGDGAMDVVVYDLNAGRIDWWENNGLSTAFTQRLVGNLATGTRLFLTIANIDDDGDLDIFTGDRNNPAEINLFVNDGTQTFSRQTLVTEATTAVNFVRVGDLDGDQDKDVFTASQWLENNGSEVFTVHKLGLLSGSSADFADMDGDGDMDIIAQNHSLQRGTYWLENTLRMNVTAATPTNAGRSVAANSNVTVTFDQPINPSTVNSNTLTITSRLRGIVPGNYSVSANTVTFTPASAFKAGDEIQVAVTNRVVSTGNHKLVENYGFDFTIAVVATGLPTFGTNPVVMTYGTAPVAMDLGDMDNDGDIDIVSCNASQLHWHRNNGAGVFTSIQIPTTGTLLGMSILDFNRDGLLDITVNPTGIAQAFINNASQNFTPIAIGNAPTPQNRIGDVDRDGYEDMVVGGIGHFSCNSFTTSSIGGGNTVASGDLDGDGDIDVLRATSTLAINRNEGGMFFTASSLGVGTALGSARADIDNDGDYDAVFSTGSQAAWYANNLNTASADFGTGGNLTSLRDARSIAAADIDGDGDIDLAGAGQAAGSAVMRNRHNEGLAFGIVQTLVLPAGIPWVIRAGDMNGDSKMDFVVMSISPNNDIRWFNNNGGAAAGPTITSFNPTSGEVNRTVTITGTNFSAVALNNTVRFNGTLANVTAATTTSITTRVPNGATTGKITVTVAAQTATSATDFTVEPPGPQINSISPSIGPVGTTVTLTGLNFSATPADNIVTFDGIAATVTASTVTTIETIVPVGAATSYPQVSVFGKSTNQDSHSFEVTTGPLPEITDFTPEEGEVGDEVILTGINFGATPADNVVDFNGTIATVITASTTSLTVIVPIGATQGYIGVRTVHGYDDTSDVEFRITSAPMPTILDFVPKQGSVGTVVTITGSNFSATPSSNLVEFLGEGALVQSSTNTEIKAVVPTGAVTGPISVTVSENTVTTTDDFTVIAPTIFIQTQPTSTVVCAEETATFTAGASGDTGITYQWQFSTTSSGAYSDLSNTGAYSGATTATLWVNTTGNVGAGFYRCEVQGATATAVLSNSAGLTINVCNPPVIETQAANTQVGGTITINLIDLITASNLDLSSLKVVTQPGSGATATIDSQGILTINYSGVSFSGTETIEIVACDMNGKCSEQAFDITVASEVVVYNAVSPGGKNPILRFQFIDLLPDTKENTVVIYNRWGDVVFEVSNYNNADNVFAGISSAGNKLPSGTYYYKVTFGGRRPGLTGFLELRY